jgi:DnaJ-class molecular chaperone
MEDLFDDIMLGKRVFKKNIICQRCEGEGKIRVFSDNPAYHGPWEVVCQVCKGSGRRIRIVTIDYKLFGDENEDEITK